MLTPKNISLVKLEAGEIFRDFLIEQFGAGALDAKKLCILAYLATQAGACGVSDLGYKPNASSDGHYSSHLKLVLRLEDVNDKFYWIRAPLQGKYASTREPTWVPIIPPPEELCDQHSGSIWPESEWTDSFKNHPVRDIAGRGNESKILGYSIYIDATPFTRPESFYGIFFTNLVTGLSALCAVFLKSDFCDCGCRGQCTLFEVHDALAHFLVAWAHGLRISKRHDDRPWLPSDKERKRLAGRPLPYFGAALEVKGDYPELCYTCGFKGHNSIAAPCCCCDCDASNIHNYDETLLNDPGWNLMTDAKWLAEVDRCEIKIKVSNLLQLKRLSAKLQFDKREGGKSV